MIDLEKFMSRQAKHVKAEFERTQRKKLPELHRAVLKRARRRRLVRNVGGAFLAVATVACIVAFSFSYDAGGHRLSRKVAVAAGGGSGGGPEHLSEWGLWPFARRELSEHVCGSSVLKGSENAAAAFAASMLRWTNVVIIGENRDGDRITSTIGELPHLFSGGPLPPHPVIKLELERLRSENCWWVTGISDPDDNASFSAEVEDGDMNVSFKLLPGAERADVIVVEAQNNLRRYLGGDAGETTATMNGFRGPGYVVVLWKGADGAVFSAAGMTLPAGDSSGRSD